jgi:hypothetical protein
MSKSVRGAIIITVILIGGFAAFYFFLKPPAVVAPTTSDLNAALRSQPATFTSLKIEPSTINAGWIMYQEGAQIIIEASGFKSIIVKYWPTGTGIGDLYPDGVVLGSAELIPGTTDRWRLALAEGLLTTNLWAVGETADGQQIKSADLGNVGYDGQ